MNIIYLKHYIYFTILTCLISLPIICKAEFTDKEAKIVKAKKLHAIRIYPDILTNLVTDKDNKKFGYISLRLDLLAIDPKDEEFINTNQALIKDKLILFLNKQTKRNFATSKRKSHVKKKITIVINKALKDESKKPMIKDIIIQKLIIE